MAILTRAKLRNITSDVFNCLVYDFKAWLPLLLVFEDRAMALLGVLRTLVTSPMSAAPFDLPLFISVMTDFVLILNDMLLNVGARMVGIDVVDVLLVLLLRPVIAGHVHARRLMRMLIGLAALGTVGPVCSRLTSCLQVRTTGADVTRPLNVLLAACAIDNFATTFINVVGTSDMDVRLDARTS